jgi:hypothetical protein
MRRSLILMVLLGGCGSDAREPGPLALEPFAERQITLAVQQRQTVRLNLNRKAPDVAFVDVDNPRPNAIEFETEVLTVLPSAQHHDISIVGLAATGGAIEIKFTLRDSTTDPVWLGVEVK